jgi:hydrogenase 3 maturation protease
MVNVVEKDLAIWFAGAKKIVIAGIGNPIRSDDYVGLKIVEVLKDKLHTSVLLLEAETVPESYLSDIEEFCPSHVLLIDAAFLGLKPGQASLFDAESVENYSAITTHLLPLRVFCEFIKQATGAKIGLLLIEPASVEFGEGLTVEVESAAKQLTEIIVKLLG